MHVTQDPLSQVVVIVDTIIHPKTLYASRVLCISL